jgi:hypothetical protein
MARSSRNYGRSRPMAEGLGGLDSTAGSAEPVRKLSAAVAFFGPSAAQHNGARIGMYAAVLRTLSSKAETKGVLDERQRVQFRSVL